MNKLVNDLLDYDNLLIEQNENDFKFSLDSILLAEFVRAKHSDKTLVDFCSGNAPITQIISTKYNLEMTGIEVQKEIFTQAVESIAMNKLNKNINMINDSVLNVRKYFKDESIDIVTCNPPYFKYYESSILNKNNSKSIARHEIKITIENIIECAKYILKNKGSFYLVHRPERLEEILYLFKKYGFATKKLQFIYSSFDNNAIIVLIHAIKNGNEGLKTLKPINITNYKSYKGIVGD